MKKKERIEKDLEVFIRRISEKEESYKLLDYIISYHLTINPNKSSLNNLTEHIAEAFEVNPEPLLSYIAFKGEINFEDLYLDQSLHKTIFNFIKNIKAKYGTIIRRMILANSEPFLIRGTEVNVKSNASTHTLKFMRNDGEELSFDFRPDSLLPVLTVLSLALSQSIQQGIYNLNFRTIDEYLTSSKQLNKVLERILHEHNMIKEEI